jgi:hypothetical protein
MTMPRIDLGDPITTKRARWLVPVLFGLLSVWLGADSNWDLFNFHLYNPFAFLHGKLATDLAPAGVQSYFNPLLDLPYYLMLVHWPGPLTGFIMGFLHGLNFVLVLGICRAVLQGLPEQDRDRVPLLLAVAGVLTANFLSELGNSMGDDMTSLFELAALYLLLRDWDVVIGAARRGLLLAVIAGLFAGLGAGLKLTNVIYLAAFPAGFLVVPLAWPTRLRLAVLFGIGAALGLATTGGFWFVEMWRSFGDPLFPMYTSIFPNPLVHPIGSADTSWRPKGLLEYLSWPFVFGLDARRVGQLPLRQIIWPVVYVLFFWWAVRAGLRRRGKADAGTRFDSRERYLVACIGFGYLAWMLLFSIYRYLVPIELLAPLLVFILCRGIFAYASARRVAKWVLAISVVVVLAGLRSWGHDPWATPMLRAELPAMSEPAKDTVLVTGLESADAWLAVQFPPELAFAGVGSDLPATRAYTKRLHQLTAARGGAVYAVVAGHANSRAESVARAEAYAQRLGLTDGSHGCAILGWATSHLGLHAQIQSAGTGCSLSPLPEDEVDIKALDDASAGKAARILERNGFLLDESSCTPQIAYLGGGAHAYQWCKVTESQRNP